VDGKARTTSDPLHLFRKYQRTGDEEIRNRLIERYLYVVEGMAKRVHGKMPSDVQLGQRTGGTGILVLTGYGRQWMKKPKIVRPNHTAATFSRAAAWILRQERKKT